MKLPGSVTPLEPLLRYVVGCAEGNPNVGYDWILETCEEIGSTIGDKLHRYVLCSHLFPCNFGYGPLLAGRAKAFRSHWEATHCKHT